MQRVLLALSVLFLSSLAPAPAVAQFSISIGINVPTYPTLERIPGYPVYYAPRVDTNYFFYDGLYWVYDNDNWYASSWYNGPWDLVDPVYVPVYLLRVPVRYYRHAPVYFRGWRTNDPPRWGEHWGHSWEQRRSGWNRWDRTSAPAPAPLPVYQRQYTGNRYPQSSQQVVIQTQNYRYQPRDAVAQQHFQRQRTSAPQAQAQPQQPQQQAPRQQARQPQQPQQAPAATRPPQQAQASPRPPQPQQAPPQGKGRDRDEGGPDRGKGPDKGGDKGGPGRDQDHGDKGKGRDKD